MQKGGKLRIQSTLKDKLCLIEFADSGVGISEQDLPRIFDAYFTTKEEGSGLGLLIVYQIIREHGGRIEVASKPRTGTTFTVILPVRKEKLGLPGPKRGPS
jgi:two-component system, sporulation sensor kinase E